MRSSIFSIRRHATADVFIGLLASCALSTTLLEVLPLTESVIMLHFDDGHIVYHTAGQKEDQDQVVVTPLDTAGASRAASYTISSADDAAYASAKGPVRVGRKTKGTDWAGQWDRLTNHAKEHWIYLFLPTPMQAGKTYTINTGALASNGASHKLTFNVRSMRSEAVHVNVVGYSTAAPEKYAYLYHWMGDQGGLDLGAFNNKTFHLIDEQSKAVAFDGTIAFRAAKDNIETAYPEQALNANMLYTDVWECDFSPFNTPGTYRVSVPGIGCSFPFRIESDVYKDVFKTTMKGLYHNRSGIALEKPYTDYVRPAPHNPTVTPGFAGHLHYSSARICDLPSEGDADKWNDGIKGPIDTWGWLMDAGDWDGYFTHLRVPALQLFTYELYPENFADGDLNIPESGNGIPDILDEASWLLRYLHRTRHAARAAGYSTGGVAGVRVTPDFGWDFYAKHSGGYPSYKDVYCRWIVSGEDP